MVFVDVSLLSYSEPMVLEGAIADSVVEDRLGVLPAEGFRYRAECTLMDGGMFILLSVKGAVTARCDLCAELTVARCYCKLDDKLSEGDLCFDREKGGYVLDDVIGDCLAMSLPRTIRCKPGCLGLCPVCGKNLNAGKCTCEKLHYADNNPFSALVDIISTGGAKNGSTKM